MRKHSLYAILLFGLISGPIAIGTPAFAGASDDALEARDGNGGNARDLALRSQYRYRHHRHHHYGAYGRRVQRSAERRHGTYND